MSKSSLFCGAALSVLFLAAAPAALARDNVDTMAAAFRDPPQEARPRVWWHWMNGNISEQGIEKDIAWMRRIGIGGLQNFDAALMTPQVVDRRLVYMSKEWKHAFRLAATRAEQAGLELAIAGSPGWSETGGPWVPPEDGMKKLSWSETEIVGGKPFKGMLNLPPATTGPFQQMPTEAALGLPGSVSAAPQLFRDIAVLAIPSSDRLGSRVIPKMTDANGRPLDAAVLTDRDYRSAIEIPTSDEGKPTLTATYAKAMTFRSATFAVGDVGPAFRDPAFSPFLEARIAGDWTRVAALPTGSVPSTVAFAPTTAREFRVVFGKFGGRPRPALAAPQPGVMIPSFLTGSGKSSIPKVSEFRLSDENRVDHAEAKAGFAVVNDYGALPTTAAQTDIGPSPAEVINLTGRLRTDGTLDWTPPKGRWRVLRLGWTLTGRTNHPAPPEATGLEVDKLDGAAVSRYLDHYLSTYSDAAGADQIGKHGVRALLLDSTEVGAFNWTPRMIEQFKTLRGYDPTPWLPALTGMLISSRADSDRFLFDFRRTISDLHSTQHYATVARIAHDRGLTLYGEALEDQRPVLGDDISMRRYADVPMAALWTWNDKDGPRPTLLGDMKGASSAGHLYGKNVIAAESMTSALAPWAYAPAELRRVIDLEFAHGINRPVIHTSVHQPVDDKVPGLSLSIFGQFFNRHESWGEMAKPWIDYISRASYLLQQGRNVADVAYFYGEDAPITAQTAFGEMPGLPKRFAYDYVNSEALTETLSVRDGELVAGSGAKYRVLYLGAGAHRMTVATLRRIADMAERGATVVGKAPVASMGLADQPEEFAKLIKRLWSGPTETAVGKGRVIATDDVEAALATLAVTPDFDGGAVTAPAQLPFVHRVLPDGDLYFVVNRTKQTQTLMARFRVTGRQAESWEPETGQITPLSYRAEGAQTVIPLTIRAEESAFIVFRQPTSSPAREVTKPILHRIGLRTSGWTVAFQPGRGAPASLRMEELHPLNSYADPKVRYYSGEAVYSTTFDNSSVRDRSPAWLDLGDVRDLAEVTLNGHLIGSAWHSPYRYDVRGFLKEGRNDLRVRVANTWVNRLIGDAQPDAAKVTFTIIPTYRADAPLHPSGLMGPLQLLVGDRYNK